MKAKLGFQRSNARNRSGEKELVRAYKLINKSFDTLVDVRCYMGRSNSASVVYASIWVQGKGFSTSGRGECGSGGIDKTSQAVEDAIMSADIELSKMIGGVGDLAVEKAINAIGRALGFRKTHLIVVWGG